MGRIGDSEFLIPNEFIQKIPSETPLRKTNFFYQRNSWKENANLAEKDHFLFYHESMEAEHNPANIIIDDPSIA